MSIQGRREIGSLAAILVILAIVAFVVLYITVLGPKPPLVATIPVALRRLQFTSVPMPTLSLTLLLGIHVENPNYAAVKYQATTALVYYHGYIAGRAPLPPGAIAAHSDEDITTVVDVYVDRVAFSSYFDRDIAAGFLNLTAYAAVHGKGSVAGVIKLEVLTHVICETMVFIAEATITSSCSATVDVSP